jgi:hypothetical protein
VCTHDFFSITSWRRRRLLLLLLLLKLEVHSPNTIGDVRAQGMAHAGCQTSQALVFLLSSIACGRALSWVVANSHAGRSGF